MFCLCFFFCKKKKKGAMATKSVGGAMIIGIIGITIVNKHFITNHGYIDCGVPQSGPIIDEADQVLILCFFFCLFVCVCVCVCFFFLIEFNEIQPKYAKKHHTQTKANKNKLNVRHTHNTLNLLAFFLFCVLFF